MNRYDFTQPGGFPFDQGVMDFIQTCITTAQQAAALAGPLAILSGCVVTGGSASNGWVVIDGEILPFVGGIIGPEVVISQTGTVIAYQDGTPRTTKFTRSATFGNNGGITNYLWADFRRNNTEGVLRRIERLEWLSAPDKAGGSMRFWNQPSTVPLPAGWQEAVSMRDWIPMGATPGVTGKEVGDTENLANYKLDGSHLPAHSHGLSIPSRDLANAANTGPDLSADGLGDHRSFTTDPAGSADPATLPLPPVKYIMFIEPIPNYIP